MTSEQFSAATAGVNRRTFVRRTLGGGTLGVLGIELLLQACALAPARITPGADTGPAGTLQPVGLPSYIPFKGPDLGPARDGRRRPGRLRQLPRAHR